MKMTQSFQLVFDMNDRTKVIEKIKKHKQWDIKSGIFEIKQQHMPYLKGCPVADSSLIMFDIPQWVHTNMPSWNLVKNADGNTMIKPLPNVVYENKNTNGHLWIYSLSSSKNDLKTIKFGYPLKMFAYNRLPANQLNEVSMDNYLKTERYLIEDNLIQAQLVISIKNQHPSKSIRFSYFDPLPLSFFCSILLRI